MAANGESLITGSEGCDAAISCLRNLRSAYELFDRSHETHRLSTGDILVPAYTHARLRPPSHQRPINVGFNSELHFAAKRKQMLRVEGIELLGGSLGNGRRFETTFGWRIGLTGRNGRLRK